MKQITRIRVERVEVPDDWEKPTPEWIATNHIVKHSDRIADFYFGNDEVEETSDLWPVLFNLSESKAGMSLALLSQLFELASTMIRFSKLVNIETGRLPRVDD